MMFARRPADVRYKTDRLGVGRTSGLGVCVGIAVALTAGRGWADGAFPDSEGVFSPLDRPEEIVLATNFGLIMSEDSGTHWAWSCEQAASKNGSFYQLGPSPRHRLFALALGKVIYSDDGSCSWQAARWDARQGIAADVFPDPTNAERVFAIGARAGDGGIAYVVFQSNDGGSTFETALYEGDVDDTVTGVESARSDPMTLYLTVSRGLTSVPMLARSADAGVTWTFNDLSSSIGKGSPSLMAVDPTDANRVFLRFMQADGEAVVVTEDGGATATKVVVVNEGRLNSFVRTGQGTVLVGAVDSSLAPMLLRSRNGGGTFEVLANQPPHLRGLSERAGVVYGAADNFADGFALARSIDEGSSWQPAMSYAAVQEILGCVKAACQGGCDVLGSAGILDAGACRANGMGNPEVNDGAPDASEEAGAARGGTEGGPGLAVGGAGCQCSLASSSALPSMSYLCCAAVALALRRRRERSRHPRRTSSTPFRGSGILGRVKQLRRLAAGWVALGMACSAEPSVSNVPPGDVADVVTDRTTTERAGDFVPDVAAPDAAEVPDASVDMTGSVIADASVDMTGNVVTDASATADRDDAFRGDAAAPRDAADARADAPAFAWREATPSPIARFEANGTVVNGELWVMGGFNSATLTVTRRVDLYDPVADSWRAGPNLPGAETHIGVVAVGSDVVVFGGFSGSFAVARPAMTTAVWRWSAATAQWSAGPPLPTATAAFAWALLGTQLHVAGGLIGPNGDIDNSAHVVWDVAGTGSWTTAAPLPDPRNHGGGAATGGLFYAVAGRHSWDEAAGQDLQVHAFNPANGSWVARATVPAPRSEIAASTSTMPDGRILVIGGSLTGVVPSADVLIYDPTLNAWSRLPSLPQPRKGAVATRIGPRIVVTTGSPTSIDPSATTWIGCCL